MGNEPSSQPPTEISHSSATGDDISVLTYDQSAARSQEHRARMDAASVGAASKDTSVTSRVSYATAKSKACPACFVRIGLDASFCQDCEDAVKVDLGIDERNNDNTSERNRSNESGCDTKMAAVNLRKCCACQAIMKHNSKDQWCKDCQDAMLMDDDAGEEWKSSNTSSTPITHATVEKAPMSPPPSRPPTKVTPNNSQDSYGNFSAALNASAKHEECLVCQARFAPTNPSAKLCNICLGVALEDLPPKYTDNGMKQEPSGAQLHNRASNQGLPSRFINPYSKHKPKNNHCSFATAGGNNNNTTTPNRSTTTASRVTPSPSSIQNPYGTQEQRNSSQSVSPSQRRVCQDCGVSTDADWKVRCLKCWSTWKDKQKAGVSTKRRLDFGDHDESRRGERKTGKTTAEV